VPKVPKPAQTLPLAATSERLSWRIARIDPWVQRIGSASANAVGRSLQRRGDRIFQTEECSEFDRSARQGRTRLKVTVHPGVSAFPMGFAILGRGRDAGSRVNEMPAIPGWRVSEDVAHGSS
jgi:hypothetical protein